MSILAELVVPLQQQFSSTAQGKKRRVWFAYTLLAVVIPFTSSITSNLLRALQTLFGMPLQGQRFYTFMASTTIPWSALWQTMWAMIPDPATEGRIIVALDDSINSKTGKKIFGCAHFHDHAAKGNQSSYPWSQCIVALGLLKTIKGRWACLPLDFRLYMMQKDIKAASPTAQRRGNVLPFQSKMTQAAAMIGGVQEFFPENKVLVVTDSWFGNNGLWSLLDQDKGAGVDLLSRLRTNSTLYAFPELGKKAGAGRPRKYGDRLGSAAECAAQWKAENRIRSYSVFLYGKKRKVKAYSQDVMLKTLKCPVRVVWVYRRTRFVALMTTDLTLSVEQIIEYYGGRWKIESGFKEIKQDIGSSKAQVRTADSVLNHLHFCMMAATLSWIYADRLQTAPDRKYKIRGRSSFAFSDIRRIIAQEALSSNFQRVCPTQVKTPQNSIIQILLRMVA